MGLMDALYKSKYDSLMKKMKTLNEQNGETFKDDYSFSQYFNNVIKIYDIYNEFESLKKRFKKFSYLESRESLNIQVRSQLHKKYKAIVKLSQNENYDIRKEKLTNLGDELRSCLNSKCDFIINDLINENNNLLNSLTEKNNRMIKDIEEQQKFKELLDNYKLPSNDLITCEESGEFLKTLNIDHKDLKCYFPLGYSNNQVLFENFDSISNILIGGTVMSGKTSYLNSIICYLLMKNNLSDLKLLIMSSKPVDYSYYNGIPHLIAPIISLGMITTTLQWLTNEISNRNKKLEISSSKNADIYNKSHDDKMNRIIVIIDDIISINNPFINEFLESQSILAWNVGINFIVVANHPTSDYMSTLSKANFPIRFSFKTTSSRDSKYILDEIGAEKLRCPGYMLASSNSISGIKEFKIPYIDDSDIKNITNYIKSVFPPKLNYELFEKEQDNHLEIDDYDDDSLYDDPLYKEVVDFVVKTGKASASLLQRRFKFGYNRAARLIDLLEERGIIGPQIGSKPRDVLVKLNNID